MSFSEWTTTILWKVTLSVIFLSVLCLESREKENMGFPLLSSELSLCEWVYRMFPLLFFSTFYLWHLSQPPHTLSGCSTRGATVKHTQSPATGDFPMVLHTAMQWIYLCVCASLLVVCVCVFCPLSGDSQTCRLRGRNKTDSESSSKSSKTVEPPVSAVLFVSDRAGT